MAIFSSFFLFLFRQERGLGFPNPCPPGNRWRFPDRQGLVPLHFWSRSPRRDGGRTLPAHPGEKGFVCLKSFKGPRCIFLYSSGLQTLERPTSRRACKLAGAPRPFFSIANALGMGPARKVLYAALRGAQTLFKKVGELRSGQTLAHSPHPVHLSQVDEPGPFVKAGAVKITGFAGDFFDVRHGNKFNVQMPADLDQFLAR